MASSTIDIKVVKSIDLHAAKKPESEESSDYSQLVADWLYSTPSWFVSMVFHMCLLFALAFCTFDNQSEDSYIQALAVSEPELLEELEPLPNDIITEEIEVPKVHENAIELPQPSDPGMAKFGEVLEPTAEIEEALSDLYASEIGEIGREDGLNGTGIGDSGNGEGIATFFDAKAHGRRIMYIVDNSSSMKRGRFENAIAELTNSISSLKSSQRFYIIFYSDTAYPLFYPKIEKNWLKATYKNKKRVELWLATVPRCTRTKAGEAFKRAFTMKPDVLYLLGDGSFSDNTVKLTTTKKGMLTTIHTFGFGMKKPKQREDFEKIAKKFNGKFHNVEVEEEFVELSKDKKRPINYNRNGPWGLKLPEKEEKE